MRVSVFMFVYFYVREEKVAVGLSASIAPRAIKAIRHYILYFLSHSLNTHSDILIILRSLSYKSRDARLERQRKTPSHFPCLWPENRFNTMLSFSHVFGENVWQTSGNSARSKPLRCSNLFAEPSSTLENRKCSS